MAKVGDVIWVRLAPRTDPKQTEVPATVTVYSCRRVVRVTPLEGPQKGKSLHVGMQCFDISRELSK